MTRSLCRVFCLTVEHGFAVSASRTEPRPVNQPIVPPRMEPDVPVLDCAPAAAGRRLAAAGAERAREADGERARGEDEELAAVEFHGAKITAP